MPADATEPRRPGQYVYDNTWQNARERIALLETVYDPGTIRHLEALGIADGWRCLPSGRRCWSGWWAA
jgi:hypothetical protein